jgi:hypothetical protein
MHGNNPMSRSNLSKSETDHSLTLDLSKTNIEARDTIAAHSPSAETRHTMRGAITVMTYLVTSVALVFLTKEILVEATWSLPLPILLTLSHMGVTAALLFIFGSLGARCVGWRVALC